MSSPIELTTASEATKSGIRTALGAQTVNSRLTTFSRDQYLGDNLPHNVVSFVRPTSAYVSGSQPTSVSCTTSLSTEQVRSFSNSIKVVISSAVTAQVRFWNTGHNPVLDAATGLPTTWGSQPFKNLSELSIGFYVANPATITSLSLEATIKDGAGTSTWVRSITTANIVAGWNDFRNLAASGIVTGWDEALPEITRLRVNITTTGATDVYIDHIWGVERPKASLIITSDLALKYFLEGTDSDGTPTGGLPDLTSRGLPCVLATQPGYWGDDATRPTVSQIRTAADQGHAISFHSYAGENTSAMSIEGIQNFAAKAIDTIRSHNIHFFPYRAAWLQNTGNLASNPQALDHLLYGIATWDSTSNGWNTWPPLNRRNMGRFIMHNKTNGQLDTEFLALKRTRPVAVHYTHYVTNDVGSTVNMVTASWEYYLTKVDQGISEGWLEVVTPEILFRRAGGRLVVNDSRSYWEWRDASGNLNRILQ